MINKDIRRITKSVIIADSIEARSGWSVGDYDDLHLCDSCKSPLFYVRQLMGIVEEHSDYQVWGRIGQDYLVFRVVGLALYCAECGEINESFYSFLFDKEKVVCTWEDDDLAYAERQQIEGWLDEYNKTHKLDQKNNQFYGHQSVRDKVSEYMAKKKPIAGPKPKKNIKQKRTEKKK